MTVRYVGIGGNDANSGLSWAQRKLTLSGVEATPVAAGDIVYVGAGIYRELLTCGVSGGNSYTTGTVSVTNGSKTVTGSGTSWLANAYANGWFQSQVLAGGTDGVTVAAGNTFTAVLGNFQAGHIGMTIRINAVGSYIILAVGALGSITVRNPDGTTPTFAGATALTYDVGPESPYEIASVDLNTQITLKEPWAGPSFTGLAYETWQDIRYIADLTGANTDGVGGTICISGSNDDMALTRANCIVNNSKLRRTLRGFSMYGCTGVLLTATQNWIIEDCCFEGDANSLYVSLVSAQYGGPNITVRRCWFWSTTGGAIDMNPGFGVDNDHDLIENCVFLGSTYREINHASVGGILIRNCTFLGNFNAVYMGTTLTTGQSVTVNNCIFISNGTALRGNITGQLIEDFNSLVSNNTDRSNVNAGAGSVGYPVLFAPPPLLKNGRLEAWNPFSLQSYSTLRNRAGIVPPGSDLLGVVRPQETNSDWGAVETQPLPTIDGSNGRGGSGNALKINGRGYHDILIPVTTGVTVTVSVYVKWDSNSNIGVKPQATMLADYGLAESSTAATGTGTTYEQLSIGPFTPTVPGSGYGFMVLRLQNLSTYSSAIAAYFDDWAVA